MKNKIDIGMKKLNLILLVSILCLLAIVPNVLSLGLAPSKQVIDYLPEKTIELEGKIYNNEEKNMQVVIAARGSLKEFIEIDNQLVTLTKEDGFKKFTYRLKLPSDLKPGQNKFDLTFVEIPSKFEDKVVVLDDQIIILDKDQKATVTTSQAIVQPIIINVPYPGKYVEGLAHISSGNVGEPVVFTIGVFNRGKDDVDVSGYVIIKGPTNEEIAKVDTSFIEGLKSNQESKVLATLNTDTLEQGIYYAEIILQYGDQTLKIEKPFSIGDLFIKIEDLYVDNFRLGTIAKINVDILSKWNKPIDEVYGEIQVVSDETVFANLKTADVYIPAYGEETVIGYWDTEGITIGEYDMIVKLSYEGKTSSKIFTTVVSIDEINTKDQIQIAGQVTGVDEEGTQFSLLIILVGILIVINVALFIYITKFKNSKNIGNQVQNTSQNNNFNQNNQQNSQPQRNNQTNLTNNLNSNQFSQNQNSISNSNQRGENFNNENRD